MPVDYGQHISIRFYFGPNVLNVSANRIQVFFLGEGGEFSRYLVDKGKVLREP